MPFHLRAGTLEPTFNGITVNPQSQYCLIFSRCGTGLNDESSSSCCFRFLFIFVTRHALQTLDQSGRTSKQR